MPGRGEAPILVLAGGKGTRLRTLDASRPKPMVLVQDRPFLHWLIDHCVRSRATEFILSTGYMAEVVEGYPWARHFPGASFRFHREERALGTGGAVRSVFACWPELERIWVLNGDTLLPAPLPEAHPEWDAEYLALEPESLFDAAPNLVVEDDRVVAERPGGAYFDAGSILVTRVAVERFRGCDPCSIHELLAPSMQAGRVGFRVVPGTCYDIGTPERFARFEGYLLRSGRAS